MKRSSTLGSGCRWSVSCEAAGRSRSARSTRVYARRLAVGADPASRRHLHAFLDQVLARGDQLPARLSLAAHVDRANPAYGDRIAEMLAMAEDGNAVVEERAVHAELAGDVVDRRRSRDDVAVRVAAFVAEEVGRRHGSGRLHVDAVDLQRHLLLESARPARLRAHDLVVVVTGEQRFGFVEDARLEHFGNDRRGLRDS